jgi:hypothetical protein
MTLGLSALGGIMMTEQLARKGRDNLITKGLFYGTTFGAITTALLSVLPKNKMKPKDATSNLSYVMTNMIYGLVTTQAISSLGNDSIFEKYSTEQNNLSQNTYYPHMEKQESNLEYSTSYFQ